MLKFCQVVTFLSILLLGTQSATSQPVTIQKARELYFSIDKEPCNALALTNLFDKDNPTSPVLMAYFGAATASSPVCLDSPTKKISYFNKGKKLISEAIANKPNEYEIRFLRFATQTKAPGFLGYNDNVEEDKKFLISKAGIASKAINHKPTITAILNFLIDSEELNQIEKKQLMTILSQIK
jgi:hypothetical protein